MSRGSVSAPTVFQRGNGLEIESRQVVLRISKLPQGKGFIINGHCDGDLLEALSLTEEDLDIAFGITDQPKDTLHDLFLIQENILHLYFYDEAGEEVTIEIILTPTLRTEILKLKRRPIG